MKKSNQASENNNLKWHINHHKSHLYCHPHITVFLKPRMTIAQRSNALSLNQMNLNVVLPEVFKLSNLIRLDLSFNNIVKLSPEIC